jgi:hypothetical protein
MQAAAIPISYSNANSDEIRRRALERLYERRATVDELIVVLERYQQERRPAPCIDISVGRKYS